MRTLARGINFTQRRVSANARSGDPKTIFGYVDLKKKRVGYPLVMHFEGRLASGPDHDICNVFADVYVPFDPRPGIVQDDPLFAALHFTVDECYRVFCWGWMSAKVRAPMAYRLSF
jgi:hypothetical protein